LILAQLFLESSEIAQERKLLHCPLWRKSALGGNLDFEISRLWKKEELVFVLRKSPKAIQDFEFLSQ